MKGKVLLIDFKYNNWKGITNELSRWLNHHNFETELFYWEENLALFESNFHETKNKQFELNVEKAIEVAKGADVVFVHFGIIPRVKASEVLGRFKAVGIKVIVNSASSISFEAADYVYDNSDDILKLLENIQKLCQKNRS